MHDMDDPLGVRIRQPWSFPCLECGAPIVAMSHQAAWQAMEDHIQFVNDTADRATDPHFADMRLDNLIAR